MFILRLFRTDAFEGTSQETLQPSPALVSIDVLVVAEKRIQA